MAQELSQWAKTMKDEMDRWLAEPDPVTKAQLKAAWERKLAASAAPKRTLPGAQR